MAGRPDGNIDQPPGNGAGNRVDFTEPVDLVAEKLHPDGGVLPVGRPQLHRIPPDPEHVALKGNIVALIADFDEPAEQLVTLHLCSHPEGNHHLLKILRLPQTIDAADRGHHDHIPPLQQGRGSGQPQPVNLLVDGGVLFNEGIRMGDICLRLIVVVVRNKILHRVVGEELLEFLAQLGGQRLVVSQHQSGPLDRFNHLGHGIGLAGAGDTQENLLPKAVLDPLGQLGDGLGLVSGRGVFRYNFKSGHK